MDDDFSKYLKELKEAEERAKKAKAGQYSSSNAPAPRFNDLSIDKNLGKAKQVYTFLKEEKKLTGVVELVLNGSRFKLRINQQNCYILFVLNGIKCMPNDPNDPVGSQYSQQALQYSKSNLLQRDADIDLDQIDKRGVFHGNLFVNKQNFAVELLERGLAFTFSASTGNKYTPQYAEVEQ